MLTEVLHQRPGRPSWEVGETKAERVERMRSDVESDSLRWYRDSYPRRVVSIRSVADVDPTVHERVNITRQLHGVTASGFDLLRAAVAPFRLWKVKHVTAPSLDDLVRMDVVYDLIPIGDL